jgi:serine/threonine protein kinase/tetratricopeptide (TPR) repeat protein
MSETTDPLDDPAFAGLLEEFLTSVRRGEQPSPEDYAVHHPDLAAAIREIFPTMLVLQGHRTSPTEPVESVPAALGDYQIVREVGRGGMGVVYEAVQQPLGRHVALKVLPTANLPGRRFELFQREARAAKLHHTNIVPIFGVGEHQGTHYYAMQFIDGQSLDVALRDVQRLRQSSVRGAEGGQPAEGPASSAAPATTGAGSRCELLTQTGLPYYRATARVALQVAEALAHAHQQGVLHRDIKPSNLLLDTQGMVWITDFGLAAVEGDETLTATGDVVGTLRYLPPERLNGVSGPRGDVYSLGLTLYEMLTLRSAFAEADRVRLMQRVTQEEPPTPRRLDPSVPRDLETIVLTATAKEPSRRYASAAKLAEDLRCFLAGEPIRARPVGMVERVWRWGRRNPALATLVAITVLALLSGTAVASYFAVQARARLGDVEAERDRAQTNLRLAWQAVDEYSLKVSNDPRLGEKFLPLRKELLQTVIPFYEKLLTQAEKGPEVQADLGRICSNLGWVLSEIGEKDKAIARLEEARAMLTHLSYEHPDEASYRASLADAEHRLGVVYLAMGKSEEAKAAHQQALDARKKLAAEHPQDRQYQADLGASYFALAGVARATGKTQEAVAAYQEVLTLRQRLAADRPEDPSCRQAVGATYNNLATAYRDLNQLAEATKAYEEAFQVRQRLAREHPESAAYLDDLSASQSNLGIIYNETGKKREAERAYQEAVVLRKRLAEQHPETLRYRTALARTLDAQGNHYKTMGKKAEAAKAHAEALAQFEQLAAEHPEVLDYVIDVAGCYCNLGLLAGASQDLSGALQWYSRAIPMLEKALRKEPNQLDARECLSIAHEARGKVLSKLGKHDEGLRDCERSLELDSGRARLLIRVSRAQVLARSGQHARADAEATELAREGSLSGEDRYHLAVVWALACAAARNDASLAADRRRQQAEEHAAHAMGLLVKLAKEGFFNDPTNVESVIQEADLDSLRDRMDFKKWLASLRRGSSHTPRSCTERRLPAPWPVASQVRAQQQSTRNGSSSLGSFFLSPNTSRPEVKY